MQAVNAELVRLYWDIGRAIDARQRQEGWGAAVIPRLARELRNDLPELKGFSERNIGRMVVFYKEYPNGSDFLPQPAAKLTAPKKSPQVAAKLQPSAKMPQAAAQLTDSILWSIPWFHHAILIEKVKDEYARLWYMQQTIAEGWSRNVLLTMIQSQAHRRQGQAVTNFARLLPPPQSDLALQTLKDPYLFDFLTLDEPFRERELETNLLRHLERFLLELGQGFAFFGRQVHLDVGGEDFYVDLLFYHLKLRCFVVIDLKIGPFKPEHAGKMNFYLGVVDDRLRHEADEPSIGLILCQNKSHIVAEYALRGVNTPIGVSEYELTRALPHALRPSLPTVEEIETELTSPASKRIAASGARPAKTRKSAKRPKTATTAKAKRKKPRPGR